MSRNLINIYLYHKSIDALYIQQSLATVPGLYFLGKLEFKCKSRGMGTCLHSRGAALNARETGI